MTESKLSVRPASVADIPALLAIYNQAILDTNAVWTEAPHGLERHTQWFHERTAAGFPVFKAELDGTLIGFASYGPFRAMSGYRLSVENSVFLAPGHHRQGHGTRLLQTLLDHAKQAGIHVMIAAIDGENLASVRLHEKLGFEQTGHLRQVGLKHGQWLDLRLLQKQL